MGPLVVLSPPSFILPQGLCTCCSLLRFSALNFHRLASSHPQNFSPVFLLCLVTKSCLTLCDPMDSSQASLSYTISWSLLKLTSIETVMPSNHLILCCPLPLLLSMFPSIRVFSSELALRITWLKCWSFSFSFFPFYLIMLFYRLQNA